MWYPADKRGTPGRESSSDRRAACLSTSPRLAKRPVSSQLGIGVGLAGGPHHWPREWFPGQRGFCCCSTVAGGPSKTGSGPIRCWPASGETGCGQDVPPQNFAEPSLPVRLAAVGGPRPGGRGRPRRPYGRWPAGGGAAPALHRGARGGTVQRIRAESLGNRGRPEKPGFFGRRLSRHQVFPPFGVWCGWSFRRAGRWPPEALNRAAVAAGIIPAPPRQAKRGRHVLKRGIAAGPKASGFGSGS